MNTSDMITLLSLYIDDVPDTKDAIMLFNVGQNKMASAVKAKFTQLRSQALDTNLSDTFVFDEEYHETPVLYAAAMYKANDSSIGEKGSYLAQFHEGLAEFSENYHPPAQYRNDDLAQQFTATDGQTDFTVTKDTFDPVYGRLKVYKNGLVNTDWTLDTDTNTFSFTTACTAGDLVTAIWEEHDEFVRPPLPWMGSW